MKKDLFVIFKIVLLLISIVFCSFMVVIYFAMDETTKSGAGPIYEFYMRYICGFPLVLVNKQYPFFFDCGNSVSLSKFLLMSGLNILCQTTIVYTLYKIISSLRKNDSKEQRT